MAIVDKRVTPLLSVNDPVLMMDKPKSLTAHTGLDALTHAIEAYVSTSATPLTDAVALEAVRLIKGNLATAVHQGDDENTRDKMAYAQFMAGMDFNNASLGYVHALAHQLGGLLDLPHGVCNAILLPHVQRFNSTVAASRLKNVAVALGAFEEGMTDSEASEAAIQAIVDLSREVGVKESLSDLGVKDEHIEQLAINGSKDVCGVTNPRQASHDELCQILRSAL